VQPGSHLDAERLHRVADRHGAADRSLRARGDPGDAASACSASPARCRWGRRWRSPPSAHRRLHLPGPLEYH
jgi:hypothetical protein